MAFSILLMWLGVLPLAAQLQIFTVTGAANEERPATGLIAMGTTATGEPLDTLIRIRNTGPNLAVLQTLTLQGPGFVLRQAPTLGTSGLGIMSNTSVDFLVRYVSESPAADVRGTLRINTTSLTVLATAVAAPALYQIEEDGSRTRRQALQATVFPPTERGARSTRRFVLENPHGSALTVSEFVFSGENFQPASTIISPFTMNARQSIEFAVAFAPRSSGLKAEKLTIDGRAYGLEGVGRDPVLPRPQLRLPETMSSGQQVPIQVAFDPPPPVDGAGVVTLAFEPAVPGPDDPAIVFQNGNRTSLTFLFKAGQTLAVFNGQNQAMLQTGTTAGTLRFQVDAGGYRVEGSRVIAAAPVTVDSVSARRGLDLLEVTLLGFDNTRSASEVTFTFYDDAGNAVPPGALKAEIGDAMRRYFQGTATGGSFKLTASFRATASTTPIRSAEVEFRNSAGTQRSQRISF
ncbi:MAG: hypothetical protein JNK87_40305 [Bryobacterales bacterium]|nr:hypothetical protein [Bryobacterales bacterium]